MLFILYFWTRRVGLEYFLRLYFVPYLVCRSLYYANLSMSNSGWWQLSNHWVIMATYLHHSDPTIVHYRNKQWSFLRGATSTVDRPLLGWVGIFFLHNISHNHVRTNCFHDDWWSDPRARLHIICFLLSHFVGDVPDGFPCFISLFFCSRQPTQGYRSHQKRSQGRLQLWFHCENMSIILV